MKYKTLFFISLIMAPIMMVIVMTQGASLKLYYITPQGIVNLELARTVERATIIYKAWSPTLINTALTNTYLDFIFIISYGCCLFLACYTLTKKSTGSLKMIGKRLCYAMIIAPVFDVFENILMLRTLSGHITKEVVASTFFFASVKFFLAAVALLFIAISVLSKVFLKKNQKQISVV